MKRFTSVLMISVLSGILTLGGYVLFIEEDNVFIQESEVLPDYTPVNLNSLPADVNADFTEAANKSVNAVVHVKNVATVRRSPFSSSTTQALQGAGSGVIISPDGYIVTNNHVIQKANQLQVTLNNNQSYMAEVIGTDPKTDIALLKIDAEDLDYLPFGDSDNARIGEWVLAVGNPFNLTSTVTAGIISAKSRDLGMDSNVSSFIQTDAAVNPGNSGGALVNIFGELIGINTAITSQTGTYVGYAFAVPSNNARKIVEDILEYGDVQQGILGIRGVQAANVPRDYGVKVSEGIYVDQVEEGSGADKAGIRSGDVITKLDNVEIRKFSDLTGYIGSKRPNDVVNVQVIRDGNTREFDVTLTKYEVFQIKAIGLEVTNATPIELKQKNVPNGVKITRGLTPQMQNEQLYGTIITAIDNIPVKNVGDVERIMKQRSTGDPITVTFVTPDGEKQKYVWR
ncbi:trypsin-like peptidase domain-containing protein [Salinimicrobium sp. TH3]|uniref:trypsin-like peptidase domain-containing protein n=1 Tax=Salinimicrobium sp. TH3 TaxID=2997342 RepID=UPI002275F0EC|nr:trypsin-like peptidase domain-containing protein [Salinimicrobium sp. TH3]MCY2687760.1 trypsin-like peptidase domain-containing protein [Salinimicrobium sp. TH3]